MSKKLKILIVIILSVSAMLLSSSVVGAESDTKNSSLSLSVGKDDFETRYFSLDADFNLKDSNYLMAGLSTASAETDEGQVKTRGILVGYHHQADDPASFKMGFKNWGEKGELVTNTFSLGLVFKGENTKFSLMPEFRRIVFYSDDPGAPNRGRVNTSSAGLKSDFSYFTESYWTFFISAGVFSYRKARTDLQNTRFLSVLSDRALDLASSFIDYTVTIGIDKRLDDFVLGFSVEEYRIVYDKSKSRVFTLSGSYDINEEWTFYADLGKLVPEAGEKSNFGSLGIQFYF
jgi:hypothetical protein